MYPQLTARKSTGGKVPPLSTRPPLHSELPSESESDCSTEAAECASAEGDAAQRTWELVPKERWRETLRQGAEYRRGPRLVLWGGAGMLEKNPGAKTARQHLEGVQAPTVSQLPRNKRTWESSLIPLLADRDQRKQAKGQTLYEVYKREDQNSTTYQVRAAADIKANFAIGVMGGRIMELRRWKAEVGEREEELSRWRWEIPTADLDEQARVYNSKYEGPTLVLEMHTTANELCHAPFTRAESNTKIYVTPVWSTKDKAAIPYPFLYAKRKIQKGEVLTIDSGEVTVEAVSQPAKKKKKLG